MRKLCTAGALLAALVVAAPAAGASAGAVKAGLSGCHTGADPLARKARFDAQMTTISGARKLQLRFDLLQRLPGARFQPIAAPGLGLWRTSTKDQYVFHQDVAGLQAPAAYRAVIRFRWLRADGSVLRSARRTTAICRQPDPGPDLAVGKIAAQRAGGDRVRYLVTVRNIGRSDAGTFDVALTLGSAQQPRETVESLLAGAATQVAFVGPRCAPGDQLTVQVDPDGRVAQSDRTDDQRVVDCPVPSR